ncbi:MAG: alcohol dehydrogenase catalytic domain-containing protein [Nostoc sp. ChiSLP02]|nr:alcohol dehydrogenase catalytic domain-containing protein [Nostoc sp. DedSLP05]MDZ8098642.1 alcohol dehydrogenase catalytic domain-containing protein [Nostoc sp. DedSLP01]MDZ8183746.1 alcohol dehydrogenase catalytic domain-containing protein [Nostoc sp. ChiSLP02]
MKAIAVDPTRSTQTPECFTEIDIEPPTLGARDLLVRVRAVSVNPADYKVRSSIKAEQSAPQILGWDAAGVVEQVGEKVTLFQPGDEVYYAGSITRPGSNSELHAVDERIVGRKPKSLAFEQAAALPLTTITAWEALFDRMAISAQAPETNHNKRLLIIGGAGGVGSIAIQLAKQVAGLTVIQISSFNN